MHDQELRALVSVDPSPEFEARVRTRIAQHTPLTRSFPWRVATALAVAATLVLAYVASVYRTPAQSEMMAVAGPVVGTFAPFGSVMVAHPPLVAARGHGRRPVARAASHPADVQIDPAEMRALQRLFAQRPAAVVHESVEPVDGPLVFPEIVIAPLPVDASSEGVRQ